MLAQRQNFSVLMSLYLNDRALKVQRSIQSIYDNTVLPTRIICVVDGPITAEVEQVLKTFITADGVFQVIRCTVNRGLASALNLGLSKISTPWTIRVDSDDINVPHRFETILRFMNKGYSVIGSNICELDHYGNQARVRKVPEYHNDICNLMPWRNPINHMSVAFKTSMVTEVGGYPIIRGHEDYALWATLRKNGTLFHNIQENLVHVDTEGFIDRRGGFSYCLDELRLQRYFIRLGSTSIFQVLLVTASRVMILMLPGPFRSLFYSLFLRHKFAN